MGFWNELMAVFSMARELNHNGTKYSSDFDGMEGLQN
jgi:hypothetical protein